MENTFDSQAGAVPEEGIGASDLGQGMSVTPPASDTAMPQEGIDLTQLPQFRQYQSQVDRAKHEAEQRIAQLQHQLQQYEEQQLQSLSPEEQLAAYKRKQEEDKRQQEAKQRQDEESQRIARYVRQAQEACTEFGVSWDHPQIVQARATLQPDADGIAQLNRLLARIVYQRSQERAQAQAQAAQQQVGEASNRARIDALNAAGVTQTSIGAPAVAPKNRTDEIKAEFRKRIAAARGKGEEERTRIAAGLREHGLTFDDL